MARQQGQAYLLTRFFVPAVGGIGEHAVGGVPELIQGDFTPTRVATHILHLLRDPAASAGMRAQLAEVRRKLGPPGAVERAAEAINALLAMSSGNAS